MPFILGTNSIKDTGYDVDNSCRFNNDSSDNLGPSVLVYVSCNFKTFAEDYETLVHGESKVEGAIGDSKGQWKLRKAKGYIYYPGSLNCIETLAIFDRKR